MQACDGDTFWYKNLPNERNSITASFFLIAEHGQSTLPPKLHWENSVSTKVKAQKVTTNGTWRRQLRSVRTSLDKILYPIPSLKGWQYKKVFFIPCHLTGTEDSALWKTALASWLRQPAWRCSWSFIFFLYHQAVSCIIYTIL